MREYRAAARPACSSARELRELQRGDILDETTSVLAFGYTASTPRPISCPTEVERIEQDGVHTIHL